MDKLKMMSKDAINCNISKLGELFPSCITETQNSNGEMKKKINYEKLKQLLSDSLIEGDESYEFSWVGKKSAIVEANRQITKTLRPNVNKSIEWDSTENIYIEGDNLDALKLLQESYLDMVKVIYIDPPYNTGSDFLYKDDFSQTNEEYVEESNIISEEGYRLIKNNDSNGRFHSDWCSMIYSRLLLARNLLCQDGVIFISIDDHEQENMKKMCSEVFGEHNFIAQVIWERAYSPVNLKRHFSESHDYILCYAKDIDNAICNGLPRSDEANDRYGNPDNDERGVWKSSDLSVGPIVKSKVYEITTPSGRKVLPPNGYCWRLDKKTFEQYVADNRIWFGSDGNNVPSIKRFLTEVKQGITPMTIWKYSDVGHSQAATKELKALFDGKAYFDYPKPVELVKRCIQLYSDKDSIIMDFFSGSATTAQAVMQLNAEDDGQRKYILVQIPEECSSTSNAYKDGYRTICDIGRDRIKRAAIKISNENPGKKVDLGVRAFTIDDSNMNDVYYSADDYSQDLVLMLEENIKSDRNDLDLFFGCLLDWGLPLSLPYKCEEFDGGSILIYNDGDLIACFEKNISESVVKNIAKRKPLRVVFRDDSFKESAEKINITEIFRLIAPESRIKVI